ncbi:MAG: aminodeoxychorismate synthase component I [Desulfatirhabdiaceae bacterium]
MQNCHLKTVRIDPVDMTENFMALTSRFADLPGTVALVSGGDMDCAQYHILGVYPWLCLAGRKNELNLRVKENRYVFSADPFDALRDILNRLKFVTNQLTAISSLPFVAGLLGYLAYDLKDCIEKLPRTSVDDLNLPHICLYSHRYIFVEDKQAKKRWLCMPEFAEDNRIDVEDTWNRLQHKLAGPVPEIEPFSGDVAGFLSSFTQPVYEEAIQTIRDYIAAGDVYQVNMSQRFMMRFEGDAFGLFEALYKKNPAPFFAFIHAGDHQVVSTSPERFVLRSQNRVETRPIKGTRPRGNNQKEDNRLRAELESSPKDDAELSMIVDLLRNDIGKVCQANSVHVTAHKRVEAYQNVYHLVSDIQGILEPGMDSVDLIRATFPGGSITGCPKIRAMEVIDELEPIRRHIYTGSIGYISFHDTMDLSIAIRTATIFRGKILFSVGGGIVYDSKPADEYAETLHKGRTLMDVFTGQPAITAQTPPIVWLNGQLIPEALARVSITDLGVQYGYGLFETIRVTNGHPEFLAEHMVRFHAAWRHMFDNTPPDVTWNTVISQVIEKNQLGETVAAVKILAIRRNSVLSDAGYDLAVLARPYRHRLDQVQSAGLRLAVYPFPRQTPLADHKTCNYLYYHLAGAWAKSKGFDEALILNPDKTVSECATANLIVICGKEALLPESVHVLAGIMEKAVLRRLICLGYRERRQALTVRDIISADQVILTNSMMGPVSAISLDDNALSMDIPFTDQLRKDVLLTRHDK